MNVLEEALRYLEQVPRATARVKADAAKEVLRSNGAQGIPHEAAKAWATMHELTMTTDRDDNWVLAQTYYFKRTPSPTESENKV